MRQRSSTTFPKGVHRTVARGKEYFTYQLGRGTKSAGPRIRLPNDPHSPEFWTALRQAQGIVGPVRADTVNALIDTFEAAWPTLSEPLSDGTQRLYRHALKRARIAWGELPARGLRPSHIRELVEGMSEKRGAANCFLTAMRVLSGWARSRDLIEFPLCDGVKSYVSTGGHRPWTEEQIKVAHESLTGALRRGFLLMLHTGQRGSDMVRLGWTMVDGDGFDLGWKGQVKTGVRPWCPILPELAKEMATWEKRPGPFVLNKHGRPYSGSGQPPWAGSSAPGSRS
jgi:hypothetical protein